IITAKYVTGLIYSFLLVLFLALLSILLGFALFGTGELISIRDKIIIFSEDDVPWRFISAYLVGFVGMTVIASLSFFFSSLVQNSIGPIIGTMAVVIIFIILGEIHVEAFESIAPYLFTKYLISWQNFFEDEIDWNYIYKSLTVLILHSVGLFFITLTLFRKKDILS
ncbi:MAG: hypothetical protein N3A61_00340, partial [Ignavibacteria bacterium]|nr:hypothetical protein [Ignavibacteria bacterium]